MLYSSLQVALSFSQLGGTHYSISSSEYLLNNNQEPFPPIFPLRAHNDYIACLKGGFLTVSVATMAFAQSCKIFPLHRFHNESLQDCKNFARLRRSTLSSLQGCCSGKRLDLWNKKVDGIKTGMLDIIFHVRKWALVELGLHFENYSS